MKPERKTKSRTAPKKEATPRVRIRKLPSGVPGLDDVLGGGIPEYSFNIIAGLPGCGKTTLAHQIAFANATVKQPALYFTVLGEPAIKMLRHQQQFSFFDDSKLGKAVRFINLSDLLAGQSLGAVLEEIIQHVTAANPSVVMVDSFRTVERQGVATGDDEMNMQTFTQRLAQFLTGWQATTFLIGEYSETEVRDNPVFTLADGLFWLWQVTERNSVVRKLQIVKLRGQASVPGLHTIRINENGLQAYSRTLGLTSIKPKMGLRRLSIGVPELDKMLGGGVHEGDSVLIAGPSGTGKSAIATQFICEGLRRNEPGIMAIFEERPDSYLQRADSFGLKLRAAEQAGQLKTLYLRPLDLSLDETLLEILSAISAIGAKRLVIDSLTGFEMALAPAYRADFRESLYRMIGGLTGAGITIVSTVEVEDTFAALPFSHYTISFLTDDIIRMRYVEIDGQLRKMMVVIKMRSGNHSKDIREYVITDKGVVVVQPRDTGYARMSSGLPDPTGQPQERAPEPKATT